MIPQAGQCIRTPTVGRLRNTVGSVSISVDTARPVAGHVIITKPWRYLLRIRAPGRPLGWNPLVVTVRTPVAASGWWLDRRIVGWNQLRGVAFMNRISLGGSPLTPRIAVWRRDPGSRLGVFFWLFCRPPTSARPGAGSSGILHRHPYPVAVGRFDPIWDRLVCSINPFFQSGAVQCPPPAGSFLVSLSSS
jgi:hypothetical protein